MKLSVDIIPHGDGNGRSEADVVGEGVGHSGDEFVARCKRTPGLRASGTAAVPQGEARTVDVAHGRRDLLLELSQLTAFNSLLCCHFSAVDRHSSVSNSTDAFLDSTFIEGFPVTFRGLRAEERSDSGACCQHDDHRKDESAPRQLRSVTWLQLDGGWRSEKGRRLLHCLTSFRTFVASGKGGLASSLRRHDRPSFQFKGPRKPGPRDRP